MKGYVRNRARPDASMAKRFLTYKCISFCQNYLTTENQHVGLPTRTHLGRLDGHGHRDGCRDLFVDIHGKKDDFERAHRVALQHLLLVAPWVEEHKILIENNYIQMGRQRKKGDVTKEHNSSFTCWFKKRKMLQVESIKPSTEDEKLVFSLSQGPGQNVRTYQSYDINSFRFCTEKKDRYNEIKTRE